MARASGARLIFGAAALPALAGALDLSRAGVETGGAGHNRRFTAPALTVAVGVAKKRRCWKLSRVAMRCLVKQTCLLTSRDCLSPIPRN